MDGFKSSFSNIPYTFIFLLFSSIGIMQFYQGPLEDPTPSVEVDAGLSPIRGHQKIPARIWEDPFEAAHSVLKTKNAALLDTSSENLIKEIFDTILGKNSSKKKRACDQTCSQNLKNKIHIYAIPLSVDSWSISQETRVKRRYATHMALYRQGFIPSQSSSIHSLCLPPLSLETMSNKKSSSSYPCMPHQYIHYEILTKENNSHEETDESTDQNSLPEVAILLWTRNARVSEDPALFVQQLSSQLLVEAKNIFDENLTEEELIQFFDFVAFWPPSSSGLAKVREILDNYSPPKTIPELRFRLVNYSATAFFSSDNNTHLEPLSGLDNVNLRITFDTVIADDSLVIDQLLDELFLKRGFSPINTNFVLVTEWENIYSRKMAKEFQKLCKLKMPPDSIQSHCNIYHFPYISGISGDSFHSLSATKIKTQVKDKSSKQQEIRLPFGSGQYDYIRRSAHTFNQRFKNKRNTVFALFGSNLDDKLLVLQAVRESNKESTIITTDVNALYTSLITKYPIRNLIIASSFPLDIESNTDTSFEDSFGTFHFRDSYQTSLFKAITISITKKESMLTSRDELSKNIELYEVGKSGFIDLNDKKTKASQDFLYWNSDQAVLAKNVLIPIIMVVLLMWLVWVKSKLHMHAEFNKPGPTAAFERTILKALGPNIAWPKKVGAVLVVYIMFFNLMFIFYALSGSFKTESSELFSGISIWVSEIGRALAISVILFSVTVSWTKLKKWRKSISKRMINSQEMQTTTDWNPFVFMNNELLTREKEHIYNRINFERSWAFFRNELTARNISIKSIYILIILSLLGAWMYIDQYDSLFNMPAHPIARGNVATLYDRFFASLSNILLTLHIAYVIVITYVCGRLVSHLSRGIVKWPQYYIDKLKKEYSKDEETITQLYSEYQGIKLIGILTNTIGPQVVTPFIALFLIIVTRNTYFDNWNYPISFLSFYSISGICLLICAIWLRMLSTKAKTNALDRLIIQKTRYLDNEEKSRSVDYVITLIKDYQKGAFSGWKDNPLVAAIMLPISSIIGINVIPW